ncbi:MAG: cell division protein FtsZ [Saprospiraceae bacterium]|nr:cell division protein FtsZ [Saprospiraceae bacterium]
MTFDIPENNSSIIKVIGVGGGGGNAVAHMFLQGIVGVDFAICNTDSQAMEHSTIPVRIALGPHLTEGRGAGSKPEVGKQACIESIDEVRTFLSDSTKMLFITAGMGGGTGTGAAPIIAKAAKEMNILTVAIVTLPFKFEGMRRQRQALEGLEQLKKNVDSILVVSNDKVRAIHGNLALSDAFSQADNILTTAAKGIAEIITVAGSINVDFEDVNTVMKDSGVAIMGHSTAEGEDRAQKSISTALNSPLLEDNDIRGAKHILLNITSGTKEVTMDEIGEITNYVEEEAGYGTDVIWGVCKDESLGEKVGITIIATGFKEGNSRKQQVTEEKIVVSLDDSIEITGDAAMATGYTEGDHATTFDFDTDDVKRTIETLGVSNGNFEPYVDEADEVRRAQRRKDMEMDKTRREMLRKNSSIPLDSPKVVAEMESLPAYARRNVILDDIDSAKEVSKSRYTVSMDDDSPLIQGNNSYLHDNVD